MRAGLLTFTLLSALGLAVSLTAHVAALTGRALPMKFVVDLNFGILLVWLPAVVVANRIAQVNRGFSWKTILSGCPAWLRRVVYFLAVYAVVNFVLMMMNPHLAPNATASARVSMVLHATSFDMAFYGVALAVLCSGLRAPHLLAPRKCPKGHAVPPTSAVCPECGHRFTEKQRGR